MAKTSSIQVHPPTDEIVIEAGLPDAEGGADAGASEVMGHGTAAAIEERVAGSKERAGLGEALDATADSSVSTSGGSSARSTAVSRRSSDGYEETTLEDLRSTSMPTTQKVVIVCAIVGIIVFVIWYLLNYIFI